jgi:predicted glycosyltransferase
MIAASMTGVPFSFIIDYEYCQNLPFIKPECAIVPEVISDDAYTCPVKKYPGIKEDVYVNDFTPDQSIVTELDIQEKDILVVIRPPATEAHYHNSESEKLFDAVITYIGQKKNTRMVILPRNDAIEGEHVRKTWPDWYNSGKIVIPQKVFKGLNLIWFSDLVVSGGGTMNREAAALGVPVYSIFRGKIGAVDYYLEENNRLTLLKSIEDVSKIKVTRRKKLKRLQESSSKTLNSIVNYILDVAESSRSK